MYSIQELPDGTALPSIKDLIVARPTCWQGMPLEWSVTDVPELVFIARFPIDFGQDNIFLFGCRYDLTEVLVGGESLGSGHFVEYFAVTKGANDGHIVHRLLQRQSVTFSESDDSDDYVPALSISDPKQLALRHPPQWEVTSEAEWPTCHGAPMRYVGQVSLPSTEVTRTLLTWGITVYLFWTREGIDDYFKLTEQRIGAQSADQHYAEEDEAD